MVDIRSIAASSCPSHREQETEGEATSRSKAGDPIVRAVFLLL
jgi:hypothetical protein